MTAKTNTTASKLTDSLRRAKTTQEKPASKTTATQSRQKPPVKKEDSERNGETHGLETRLAGLTRYSTGSNSVSFIKTQH